MKFCLGCMVEKGLSEFGRQSGTSDGLRTRCKACRRVECSAWRESNPEYRRRYYREHAAEENQRDLLPERKAQRRAYSERNRDRIRAYALNRAKQKPELFAAQARKRQAAKLQATAHWADPEAVLSFYQLAAALTAATGEPWHVDHIVPLVSELVCGLHVESNLAVIPAAENIAKGNRYWPDMP